MKAIGLIVVLAIGVLVMTLVLVPFGVTMRVIADEDGGATVHGKLRVAQVIVHNDGWFSQTVRIPEYTACVGEQEVPLDAWLATEAGVVRGTGQVESIRVRPHDVGVVYLIASDATLYETVLVFERTPYFTCLNAGTPLA